MKKHLLFVSIFCYVITAFSQIEPNPLTQDLKWRNIGPANMMGRIAAVEALDSDYKTVLVASASGGVFKSSNAGITWEAIFDDYGAGSIGAVAFFQPNPEIIWVGTGEAANRNSSAYGDGIYKSVDGGVTFENMGLKETHQIAEIATHPTDPNIVYVAAVGHLWGYSGERGLFRTVDGGATWEKLTNGLPDDGKTGCTEIIMNPDDPNILFAGFYQRLRQPASFHSGGPNGGLFKSTDGGKSWRKIEKGLARGETGMVDISIHKANPEIMVMAYEADENLPEGEPATGVYRSDDEGDSWTHLLKHAVRPFYHGQIEIDPIDPNNIYVVSRGFMISRDGGKTFKPRQQYTDGGDDHDMWISPQDNNIMYLATDQGARMSMDGGANWLSFNNMAIGQYYAIGVDMRDPYWVIGGLQDNGIWMGPSNSRERRGILNMHNTWVAEGDGFHSQIDPTDWRTVYTVNHVGFVARQNVETREHVYITPTPESIANFNDYVDFDYDETPTKYTIDPGEHWFFYERPERPLLPPQFRFNWSSPFIISPTNSRTVYFGSNHLFKSDNRGDTWKIISPDLTTNDPALRNTSNGGGLTNSNTGGENHFTIITISESPINDDVVWVGTDDGNVQVTQNGGESWTNVKTNFEGVPEKIWVSRVEASHFASGTAYVTFDNHRYDDNKAYVFKTTDFGMSWTNIASNLPDDYSVYVVKEDLEVENLLFVGTEQGVYTSINSGTSWHRMANNIPTVAVHDLVIHPREGDLIAGTHGRSIWIMDDIGPLRQLAKKEPKVLDLFESRESTKWIQINTGRKQPVFEFRGENPDRGAIINFYSRIIETDTALITISQYEGDRAFSFKTPVQQGVNRAFWRFDFPNTVSEIEVYKNGLEQVIISLKERVKDKILKKELKTLSVELEEADNYFELNEFRSTLVKNYNAYAGGKAFFPQKLVRFNEAEAGKYKVTIQLGDNTAVGEVVIREDPLMLKPYN